MTIMMVSFDAERIALPSGSI